MIAYYLVDEVAERYLDLLDDLDEEIDELEDHVDEWPPEKIRQAHLGLPARPAPHQADARADARRGARDRGRPGRAGGRTFGRARCSHTRSSGSSPRPTTSCFAPPKGSSTPATSRERPRLPAGEDLDRPERGDEAAHGDRLDPARPDLHRRALRAELQAHTRAPLGLRLLVVVGLDSREHRRPGRVTTAARAGSSLSPAA